MQSQVGWEAGAGGWQGGTDGVGRAWSVGLAWWEVKEGLRNSPGNGFPFPATANEVARPAA